tara:strand:+ start:11472 stop:11891 length:420 start_codon:yes stop_codon:yes gene_type:complete
MIIIRKYKYQDKHSLIKLWQQSFPDPAPYNEPALVLAEKLKVDNFIFVAEKSGLIIGSCMAGYDGHRGWLYSVAVCPDHRRTGIGSKLIKHAIKQLNQQGCAKVNLQILEKNKHVIEFYRSLGFSVENRISMGQFTDNS